MKKYRIVYFVLAAVVILSLVFFGVFGKRASKTHNYGSGPYTNKQISTIYQDTMRQGISISELESACDVTYLDKEADTKTVVIPGDTSVLVLKYDENGELESGAIREMSRESETFDAVNEGVSIHRVMELDPDGDYGFAFSGRNDLPRHSYHYTPDGYCIDITYDDNNEVVQVEKTKLGE